MIFITSYWPRAIVRIKISTTTTTTTTTTATYFLSDDLNLLSSVLETMPRPLNTADSLKAVSLTLPFR